MTMMCQTAFMTYPKAPHQCVSFFCRKIIVDVCRKVIVVKCVCRKIIVVKLLWVFNWIWRRSIFFAFWPCFLGKLLICQTSPATGPSYPNSVAIMVADRKDRQLPKIAQVVVSPFMYSTVLLTK
jgi:hypothetical protein